MDYRDCSDEDGPEAHMDQTHATLLLVDDDAMNRDMLSRRLARKGYTVLTAESGPRAGDAWQQPHRRGICST